MVDNASEKKKIYRIRLENLKFLEKKYSRYGLEKETGKSYKILSKYLNGYGNVGRDFAIDLEVALRLPEFWMDQDHSNEPIEKIIPITYLTLPILSVQLSPTHHEGGSESTLENNMIISEYQRQELEAIGTNPTNAQWFKIEDDTMLPTLKPAAWVIVDTQKKEIESGDIYAYTSDNKKIEVRRIFKEGPNYRFSCDNPLIKVKYPDWGVQSLDGITILGKLVWQSGKI